MSFWLILQISLISTLTLFGLVNCESKVSKKEALIITGLSKFAREFYPILLKSDNREKDNHIFCPYSLYSLLNMLYHGTDGKTKAELKKVLGFQDADMKEIKKSQRAIFNTNPSKGTTVFNQASNIFVSKETPVKESYKKLTHSIFNTTVQEVDFSHSSTRKYINKWVEKKTHNKIKELFPKLNPSTLMVLLNAVYFKGLWKNKFEEKATGDQPFHILKSDKGNKAISVPTMIQTIEKLVLKKVPKLLSQIVELPFKDKRYVLRIVLPDSSSDFLKVQKLLEKYDIAHIDMGTKAVKRELYLPKFKLEAEYDLGKTLPTLGLKYLFDEGNLMPMIGKHRQVDAAKQKAVIEVNEKGAEAAAVTFMTMSRSAISIPSIKINRPFFFAIVDNKTKMSLFIGQVTNPLK